MKKSLIILTIILIIAVAWAKESKTTAAKSDETKTMDEIGGGIALKYPGDIGIEQDPSVIFVENFEAESLADVIKNWSWSRGDKDSRLSLDNISGPEGTPGNKCLKMTISRERGEVDAGSDLIKIFDKGYEQVFLRFYVKFADDYGYNHHFTSLSGLLNPTPAPPGGTAGQLPTRHFSSTIDQITRNLNGTGPAHAPPGYWSFYSYWPEMHSWQNSDGTPDGRPNPYYGNIFMPENPVPAERGEWQCIETMIRINSSSDKTDGAHAFWVNGELVGHWDPLENTPVKGYWNGDVFVNNPKNDKAEPFPGIKWRMFEVKERFEAMKINRLRVQNYVSETSWRKADKYASEHPDFKINLREATVWKDHIVVATEYIGPIEY